MATKGDIIINIEKCKGCQVCLDACPKDVLDVSSQVNAKGYQYIIKVNAECTGCANCAVVCPDAVITVYRSNSK